MSTEPEWYEDDEGAPPESWDDPMLGEGGFSPGSGVPRALGAGDQGPVPAPHAGEDSLAMARAKIRGLVPSAVDVLEDLMETGAQRVRLGAAKEVLDRGGLPARAETHIEIDVTMDEQIEGLLRSLSERKAGVGTDIQDAEVVEGDGVPPEYGVGADGRWGALVVEDGSAVDGMAGSGAPESEGNVGAGVGSRGAEMQGAPEVRGSDSGVPAGVLPGRGTAGAEGQEVGQEGVPLSVGVQDEGAYTRPPSEGETQREREERLLSEGASWQAHPHKSE